MINVSHRIADTQKVILTDMPQFTHGKRQFKLFIVPILLVAITLIVSTLVYQIIGRPAAIRYEFPSEKGTYTTVRITPRTNGRIKIRGVEQKDLRKTIDIEEFADKARISQYIVIDSDIKACYLAIGICTIFPIMLWLLEMRDRHKASMLHDILSMDTPNEDKEKTKT